MRIRTVMAAAVSTIGLSCVAEDFATVEPTSYSPSRAAPHATAGPPDVSAHEVSPSNPPPSRQPAAGAGAATSSAPPPATPPAAPRSRVVPADLEPLFVAAAREQPPGERTVELIAVASAMMREQPQFAAAIGDRLDPVCREVFFSDAIVAGMDRIGLRRHAVKKGESPWKIARAHAVEPPLVARLNPTAEPTHLRIGQRLKVLDLASADLEVVIDLAAHRLSLFRLPSDGGGAQLLVHVPVAIGAATSPTPRGSTRVERIVVDPLFVDRKENTSHGPLDPKNPWGKARVTLEAEPLDVERCEIHGRPGRDPGEYAGKSVTDGDIWMPNDALTLLVECLRVGVRVELR